MAQQQQNQKGSNFNQDSQKSNQGGLNQGQKRPSEQLPSKQSGNGMGKQKSQADVETDTDSAI